MRFTITLACAFTLAATHAHAQRVPDPSAATVLIRVMGNVHLEVTEFGTTRIIDRSDVQTGSGSGFVLSPHGYVATAQHVVAPREWTEERGPATVRARVSPTRFEVVFPKSAAANVQALPLDARIVASDPSRDVAVLFVAGTFSYLALGDSAAVERGHRVQAIGFPFGGSIDTLLDAARLGGTPEPTIAGGTVTALRTDAAGDLQSIQIDSTINPGNSGGPLLDEDGRAVGVVVAQFKEGDRGTGLGFAVPINVIKELLERHGLDQSMPVRRLRVGPLQDLPSKGVRVGLLEYRNDLSPFRVRVDLGDLDDEVSFRADRVHTPWTVQEVEQWLLSDSALEPALVIERTRTSAVDGSGRLLGRARARHRTTKAATELLYTIVDVGAEVVVARFAGPADQVAFNRSVLNTALTALEADALLSGPANLSAIAWTADRYLGADAPDVTLPSGWFMQVSSGTVCGDLPPAMRIVSVSPPEDFTLTLRLAWWPSAIADAKHVVAACGGGLTVQAPFVQKNTWAGVTYITRSLVRSAEGGAVLLSAIAPSEPADGGRAIFEAWAHAVLR